MFTNLVESSADKRAFRRRSSFFLGTVASYALIISAAGVVGVLTYDAHVEAQTTEVLIDWIPPIDRTEPEGPRESSPVRRRQQADAPVERNLTDPLRTKAVTTTDDPLRVPDNVGVKASDVPPVTGRYQIADRNANPPSATPDTSGCVTCTGGGTPKVVETETAPLPPKPPETIRAPSSVILSKVMTLPKPAYPEMAKRIGIQGPVNVQILIDEAGNVISAQAVKGNAMLTGAATDAARRAKFTPTKLGGQPVKVQGVITYNFVLQ